MFRKLLFSALFALCALCGGMLAQAGSVYTEGSFTVPAGATGYTNPVALTAGSVELSRVVIFNAGQATGAVAVVASDLGVFTAVDTFALAATSGKSQVPPGLPVVDCRQVNVVTGDVVLTTYTYSTNYTAFAVRNLELRVSKQTNATDCVYRYGVYGRDR